MLENLANEAARQQAPLTQLSWLVASVSGNKSDLKDWHTGYAIKQESNKSKMPPHLERALEVGLKLKKVSDEAFVTMRQLR